MEAVSGALNEIISPLPGKHDAVRARIFVRIAEFDQPNGSFPIFRSDKEGCLQGRRSKLPLDDVELFKQFLCSALHSIFS